MITMNNTTVFITGASAGIGEATARVFAEAGARLLLAARRLDRLKTLAAELKTPVHCLALDVRNRAEVEQTIASVPPEFSRIDILVNNAGLSRNLDKLHEGDPAAWDEMIDTNVKGLLYVTRAVLPGMVQRGKGHVINIGSIAGHQAYPGGNVYCASKHAVVGLTRGMRMDVIDTPIRVTAIEPGMVETEFSVVRFHGDTERAGKVYEGVKPLTGRDVADAILWAASRPEHVQIAEMVILPKDQAGSTIVHRRTDD